MKKTFSFELFPPRTEAGFAQMQQTVSELNTLAPAFFSVTYGAGGTTQDGTFQAVDWLRSQNIDTAPHLTCVGATPKSIADILQRYINQGIRRIVALRGDMPSGMHDAGELRHADDLVHFIRAESGDHFHIEVAAYPEFHPQASSARQDLLHLKAKFDAGADSAITQYFFNSDSYTRLLESATALGIQAPIVPGIMPISNFTQLARFSDACGAEIPRWLRWRLQDFADDLPSLQAYGIEVISRLCQDLLDAGAPGLHFYSMNRAHSCRSIWSNLNIDPSGA
ncbi:MAG: methylenetetrahydrofolate reductase [NAD(P)H] [gamma proteobacterium symbiont of Bathyaustriella thionipta]|nr:methylenetetrahydrofolate reductase [NAD(P)H] [gamma proteobacterium symbiont of Bathyaustriella thionipta]